MWPDLRPVRYCRARPRRGRRYIWRPHHHALPSQGLGCSWSGRHLALHLYTAMRARQFEHGCSLLRRHVPGVSWRQLRDQRKVHGAAETGPRWWHRLVDVWALWVQRPPLVDWSLSNQSFVPAQTPPLWSLPWCSSPSSAGSAWPRFRCRKTFRSLSLTLAPSRRSLLIGRLACGRCSGRRPEVPRAGWPPRAWRQTPAPPSTADRAS